MDIIMLKKAKELASDSWFTLEEETDTRLTFATREHGNVCEEEPGSEDIEEAKRIRALIISQLPQLEVTIDVCDEWVSVNVAVSNYINCHKCGTQTYRENAIAGLCVSCSNKHNSHY